MRSDDGHTPTPGSLGCDHHPHGKLRSGATDGQTNNDSEGKDDGSLGKTISLRAVCGRKPLVEIFSALMEESIRTFSSTIAEK